MSSTFLLRTVLVFKRNRFSIGAVKNKISKASIYHVFSSKLGILHPDEIAGVTREGRFAGHLIKAHTQLVFMDEWTEDSLSCEDAKRILQGRLAYLNANTVIRSEAVR